MGYVVRDVIFLPGDGDLLTFDLVAIGSIEPLSKFGPKNSYWFFWHVKIPSRTPVITVVLRWHYCQAQNKKRETDILVSHFFGVSPLRGFISQTSPRNLFS